MKRIILDHIQFVNNILRVYEQIDKNYDMYGVFGLGYMVWVGIQNSKLHKEKISYIIDENKFLSNKKRHGIEIKNLDQITNLKHIPILFSINPCYMHRVILKLDKMKANYVTPTGYDYYLKYYD